MRPWPDINQLDHAVGPSRVSLLRPGGTVINRVFHSFGDLALGRATAACWSIRLAGLVRVRLSVRAAGQPGEESDEHSPRDRETGADDGDLDLDGRPVVDRRECDYGMVSYNIERMTDALTGGVVVPAGSLVEDDHSKNPNDSQAAHSQNRPGK